MRIQVELTPESLDALAALVAERLQPEPGAPWPAEKLAKRAGMSAAAIRQMAGDGRLPRVPGTARVLIPDEAARAFLAGR